MRLLRVNACAGPDGCHGERAVVWQGACGCWVFKCLLCGDVDQARCSYEAEHMDAFDEAAMELVGEYSNI
jgi:hypothetical protein